MRLTYLISFSFAGILWAQAPPARPARPAGAARPSAYPERPPADPAVVARGKATFGVHCSFCHGSDARGGEGGPNLIRSELVLNDKDGEKITPVVQNGRPDRGMPKFDLSASAISDIATYIHSFKVGGYDISRQKPVSILVGDPKAGETYFSAKCASCHSVTGDLKGFGAKFSDPRTLQQTWLAPGGAGRRGPGEESPVTVKPITVTVTLPSGEKVEGRLVRADDFIVILTKADGTQSSFRRDGDSPKVEVHDPTQPHRDLLATYTDKDIHNLTAYLVTLK
jgi:cytochrome c oxidase cbb3-type subunit III